MDMLSQFLSVSPVMMAQAGLVAAATVLVFLVLFATRDILLRTDSFLYQLVCVVLVAGLPLIGFLVYLLIRPARTRKERQLAHDVAVLMERLKPSGHVHSGSHHHQKKKLSQAPGFKMTTTKVKN